MINNWLAVVSPSDFIKYLFCTDNQLKFSPWGKERCTLCPLTSLDMFCWQLITTFFLCTTLQVMLALARALSWTGCARSPSHTPSVGSSPSVAAAWSTGLSMYRTKRQMVRAYVSLELKYLYMFDGIPLVSVLCGCIVDCRKNALTGMQKRMCIFGR